MTGRTSAPTHQGLSLPEDLVEWSNDRLVRLVADLDWTGGGVVSGLGWDWAALELVAAGSDAAARETCGVTAAAAAAMAATVDRYVTGHAELAGAFGVFVDRATRDRLLPAWQDRTGVLDQGVVDRWVAERTGQRIGRFPIDPDAPAVALSAVAASTRWQVAFDDSHPDGMLRRAMDPGDVVADDRFVGVRVAGTALDVWLVAAVDPATPPVDVVIEAVRVAQVPAWARSFASPLPPALDRPDGRHGPMTVAPVAVPAPGPDRANLTTRAFDVDSTWDLAAVASGAAALTRSGIAGLCTSPLDVGAIAQSARMRFDASGFEAAAVTGVSLFRSVPRHEVRDAHVVLDGPFAVACADPICGIVPFAGWVTPDPAT